MKIGPRYKIARRLGAAVFDKTQTAKYAARAAARRERSGERPRGKTDYGLQMLEKQRVRFSYGINERQFKRYVGNALAQKHVNADEALFKTLETRLDNVVYRLGFANSRAFARQLVTHGHITVNGKKVNVPSFNVAIEDKIGIRVGSQKNKVFDQIAEKTKEATVPAWIAYNPEKKEAEITALPTYLATETPFNIGAVLEFYRRS
jgi:small subunit ribosomal protein S4